MSPAGGGPRGRLALLAIGLTALIMIPGGLFLEHELRAELDARLDAELDGHAEAVRLAVQHAGAASLPELADDLGRALGRRVTIVGADGVVLGDSQVARADLAGLENHGGRPEIQAALRTGHGRTQRYSDTLDVDMRYVAVALADGRVVRVAQSVAQIDGAIRRLRLWVGLGALITIGVAVVVAAVAARLVAGSLRELVVSTRDLAAGSGGGGGGLAAELERTITLLARERERLRAVLEGMGDAVVAIDHEQTITLMNPAARALLGAGEDARGRPLLEIVRAPALQDLLASREAERSAEFELPGGQRRVLVSMTPEQASGGTVLVLHDVTTIRRLETVRRDFVANVSHELRTPISIVSANAETLRAGALADPEVAPVLVAAIERNADRLRRLIEDLLDLSRLEAGRYRLEPRPVELAAAARRAVDAIVAPTEARGAHIAIEIDDRLTAVADADGLQQILVNLLDNAVKYGAEGGHIVVGARRDAEQIRIEVRDEGPGIAPSDRERVFERFYRVDPGRARGMGGTGLGLAIVKHLLESMDGRVGVAGNLPRGTIVWFELPAADPA